MNELSITHTSTVTDDQIAHLGRLGHEGDPHPHRCRSARRATTIPDDLRAAHRVNLDPELGAHRGVGQPDREP